ncbi:hypothetical protein C0991_012348 [Blastosporella zonata]|nr:hypothetical protein C0991_012348 [Blastosporella zonata]
MNTRPEWIKYRAHSAPLPSTPSHSRSQSRSVATALDKLKIQSKKRYAHDKKLERASSRLQFLMPRVEIIDDTNQTNLIVKLEIPDVNPSDVHLKLHGTLLSIYGERQPDLSAIREEYRDGLRFHSQTRMDGNHSPSVILLGRGRVASFLSNQVHVPSKQQQQPAPQPPSSPPQGRTRAERVHYSELRYGAFCRNLRVPQGTMVIYLFIYPRSQYTNGLPLDIRYRG